ncbi:hypothetical protein JCM13304A_03870 [Desulfothermus okinawensis JCM 13304]
MVLKKAWCTFLMFLPIFFIVEFKLGRCAVYNKSSKLYEERKKDAMGVCPPFYLLDENGNIINPVKHINDHVPYSPEKTCGRCHDYKKITKAYHFMQGKGEKLSKEFKEMYPWCTSPGQYGGRW